MYLKLKGLPQFVNDFRFPSANPLSDNLNDGISTSEKHVDVVVGVGRYWRS